MLIFIEIMDYEALNKNVLNNRKKPQQPFRWKKDPLTLWLTQFFYSLFSYFGNFFLHVTRFELMSDDCVQYTAKKCFMQITNAHRETCKLEQRKKSFEERKETK